MSASSTALSALSATSTFRACRRYWSWDENGRTCEHCGAKVETLINCCVDCEAVAYCGDACKESDSSAHAHICKRIAAAMGAMAQRTMQYAIDEKLGFGMWEVAMMF
jgi:hypothetical protein